MSKLKETYLVSLGTLDELDTKQFSRVYIGKQGCACGCRGTYHETSRMFKSSLTKIKNKCIEGEPIEVQECTQTKPTDDANIICWEGVDRAIRIYTTQKF
jgi:hypothetical protein